MKTLAGIAIVVAALIYLNFGSLSPCDILRERVRQQDGLAAVMPTSIIDLALTAQYGSLTPGLCMKLLLGNRETPPVTSPPKQKQNSAIPKIEDEAVQLAYKKSEKASLECRAKRLSGEFKTFMESTRCSNPHILRAFGEANYRHMDLITLLLRTRLEIAGRLDRKEITEAQAEQENNSIWAEIGKIERQRDTAKAK